MVDFIQYKNILWDYDGVLMDSMPVRDKGFEKVLEDFPAAQVEELMVYHRRNGGLSRYVKFRYFYEEILGRPITDEEVNALAGKFSEVMLQLLINPQLLIHDTIGFVKSHHQDFNMHIVSGSDGKELNFICQKLEIAQFFKTIHGSPTPKKQLVANVISSNNYKDSECVLIGDSINDFEAAVANNIDFIGYNNKALARELDCKYIDTFAGISLTK